MRLCLGAWTDVSLMEELHTDSIDVGYEASYRARSRARERAYSNNHETPWLRKRK
jgi:hypothetical protein